GSCTLGDRHSEDPRIAARAVTAPFRLEEFRQYIPYGVIVRDTAEFIERHIKGGTYRLDDGRLDGRVSQILHMERGDNYNVLAIRGHVDKGVVTFGPRVPVFNNIRGELEMRGKDFLLRRMTGNFGGSPFSLEGQIADYPLDTPARYPFTMTIDPGEAEVAWLFRQGKPSEMAFSGRSLLRLTGSGSVADYRLTGTWDLSGADYRYRQLVHKPASMTNRLRFDARLGNSEARLADLRYELPQLEVAATATYRYSGREPLTFVLTANRFRVDPHLAIFPWLQQYHPSGAVQAHIAGAGNPAEPEGIRLKGDVKLEGFSVRPFEEMKPLTDVTGTIHVTEAALETEQLTARVGDTAFTVRARLAGRAGPVGDLVFSSPELHPEDFGLHGAGQVPEVKNLSASIALKDRHLTIASLSGEVAHSRFTMSGDLPDIGTPKGIMRVDFPYLRVEDLEPLARLRRTGEDQGPPADMTLQARVTSAAGSARGIPFERLDAELTLAKDQLVVTSSSVGAFGGIVSGNGRVDFVADGGPSYQAHYHLDRVDAARLLRAAGEKPLLAGVLAAEGELTARGKTPEALKRSAHASVRLRLQDGELAADPSSEASAGTRIPCGVLDAHLTLKDEVLAVQGLNAEIFGGTVSGNGWVDFTAKGGPAYQAHYRLDRVDAARLLREAGIQQQLTGLLAAEGEVTFRGNTREELKNTAQGDATILLTEGVFRLPATAELKTAHEFPFKKAQARLSFDRKKIDLQSARIEAFEGVISAHGGADFSTPDGPGYRITCDLTNIAAAGFFRAVDTTRDISGLLTLQSELTARDADVTALKRSVRGTLKVHLEKGVINKFGLISKVFSLLNVSQLLDFSLPDMVSTGMAYDHIDGNFSLHDGSVSTRDLSMHSPSLNMTLVGKTDLVSRDIDVKIGVQPLQTVGKIVNRIPIVGWILTGGKKDLIVVYYEAKGKWDDPTVSAIPSTSLSRGVSNIFRRAFNLPEEMVTEPAKVFIGE
ncbi:MAG TPA: AsmA-like C-terminal domain-containing protein, partial [Geobacteraceae bacterium]